MLPLAPLAALLLSAAGDVPPSPPEPARFPRISVQVDPIPFALRGYSLWVGIAAAPHWHVTVGSFGGDALGESDGWKARIRFAPDILVSYFLREDNRGFYAAAGLGVLLWSLTRTEPGGATAQMDQVVLTPMVGYRWFPSSRLGLFVEPFASIALPLFRSEVSSVEGLTYRQPFTDLLLPGVFLGWEF